MHLQLIVEWRRLCECVRLFACHCNCSWSSNIFLASTMYRYGQIFSNSSLAYQIFTSSNLFMKSVRLVLLLSEVKHTSKWSLQLILQTVFYVKMFCFSLVGMLYYLAVKKLYKKKVVSYSQSLSSSVYILSYVLKIDILVQEHYCNLPLEIWTFYWYFKQLLNV